MLTSRLLRLLLLVAGVWGVISALAYLYAERILFQPPPSSYGPGQVGAKLIPVGRGDAVAVQHLPNPDARYTLLFSHGNAEDLGQVQPLLRRLHGAGFAVLAYDYRGYGLSTESRPSEARAIEDAEAVYDFATSELGVRPDRLIVHGRSLGGGPALEVASRHPVAGVVLESTFVSTYRVVTTLPLLPFDRFPNLRRVEGLRVPVLIMHGSRDRVIRPSHGRALFRAAPEPKRALWVAGAGHNDLAVIAGDRYVEALRAFARSVSDGEWSGRGGDSAGS